MPLVPISPSLPVWCCRHGLMASMPNWKVVKYNEHNRLPVHIHQINWRLIFLATTDANSSALGQHWIYFLIKHTKCTWRLHLQCTVGLSLYHYFNLKDISTYQPIDQTLYTSNLCQHAHTMSQKSWDIWVKTAINCQNIQVSSGEHVMNRKKCHLPVNVKINGKTECYFLQEKTGVPRRNR